ncbi:MAG TPA: tRNA 2-thiouridine(34) synthase MnmA [Steroidobacteraceae bacterium]|nr:tRNA 2-thiouridine(34) synthase MnmA [Steroidobacteraceae bacterium]
MADRIIVALSGGVDSAVTALLLRRAGHEVQGLFMHNWEEDDQGYCTAAEDFQDARRVAAELGIALHRVDLSAEYRQRVFAEFLAASRAGLTPNPDVLCNREIKFGDCLRHALRLGGSRLATGHYARLVTGADGPELHKGIDAGKDQSYFLHAVARDAFAQALMPLGELHKVQVRELAHAAGLPVAAKRDSTGICFIGERPFRDFLAQHLSHSPGPIVSASGSALGEHIGLPFYTLGQRGGIGIGGQRGGSGAPWYVVGKRADSNTLIVAQGEDHQALYTRRLTAHHLNWLCATPPQLEGELTVRLRYRQSDQLARVSLRDDGNLDIAPDTPQRAVTPGQSAVVYRGTRCLGGGVIAQTEL